ncbi:hypothetical protein ACIP9X_14410 [Arthrobacter sp. NPDC093125]|uniref:hypothetical protein n=1 Tax=Arthrobacter sp. NPDC093125 TaxID=3363944 RepID=UPI0038203B48
MAQSAAEAIQEQVQQRYGINVTTLGTGASAAATLNEAERAKTQAQEERTAASSVNVEAAQLLAEAEREDKGRRQNVEADNSRPEQLTEEASAAYDSEERRAALAKSLDHIGDSEAVQARLIADRDQVTPPAAAVSTRHTNAPKARKTRATPEANKQAQKGRSR